MIGQFLTGEDLLGHAPDFQIAIDALSSVPIERGLDWVARMLAKQLHPGTLWEQHQKQLARTMFGSPEGRRARDLVLSGERSLLVPHVLLRVARLALLHGNDVPAGDHEDPVAIADYEQQMMKAMLVVASHLSSQNITAAQLASSDEVDAVSLTALDLDLTANMLSNHRAYPASMFDRSARRWLEIPAEDTSDKAIDLAGEFEAAFGVALDDLRTVGLVLWARAFGTDGPRIPEVHFAKLGLPPDRVDAVMNLIAGTVDQLRQEAQATQPLGDYDVSLFGQRPLIRLANGQVLILSPALLMQRTLGWLPMLDLTKGTSGRGDAFRKRMARAEGYLRHTTQVHAEEALAAVAATAKRKAVVYREDEIQPAYGTASKNADVAVRFGGGDWLVAEISSRSVMRGTAAGGSAADLAKDLQLGIITKARQIDQTIADIRADESRLTGTDSASRRRRFTPMLVFTEGFPLIPSVTSKVVGMLRAEGILQGADTNQIVMVDIEGLEVAESIAEDGGPDLIRLIDEHRRSPLNSFPFRDWMIQQYGTRQAARRIMDRWDRVLTPLVERIEESERDKD